MSKSPSVNRQWLLPITLTTNVTFVVVASLFLAATGWLMQTGILSSLVETDLSLRYSPWATFIPLKTWMQLAVILSLVLPIFALFLGWGQAIVRRTMLLYVVILLIQISTEMTFLKLGLPGMNFIVGFVYTTYRVWQLWFCKQQFGKQKKSWGIGKNFILAIFLSGIVFWTVNWLILAI